MRRRIGRVLALVACALSGSSCVFVSGDFSLMGPRTAPLEERVVSGEGDAKILLIDISGPIHGSTETSPIGLSSDESTPSRVQAELRLAAEDDDVRAVVLRIDSPGGGVGASDAVFQQVRRFADEREVPVVVQLLDLATSGGYYAALAGDEIIASPTTVTGSIGAVLVGVDLSGLLQMVGVRDRTLASGSHKDMGSPLRPMDAEEEEILRGVLASMRDRFLDLVQLRRPAVDAAARQHIADGRLLTAAQALDLGLVDRIGYLEEAIATAQQRAGVAEARVVLYRRKGEFAESIYSRSTADRIRVSLVDLGGQAELRPGFHYLWLAGAADGAN